MGKLLNLFKKTTLKTRVVSAVLSVTVLASAFVYFGNDKMGNVGAAESSKPYMEYIIDRILSGLQDDFTILEIVPDKCLSEFGYYVGDPEIENGLEENQTLLTEYYRNQGRYFYNGSWSVVDEWKAISTDFSNFGYELRFNSYTNLFEVKCPELFINNVIPSYAGILDGKINLNTVEANDLTIEDVNEADLIILSTSTHDQNTKLCYEKWSGESSNVFYTSTGSISDGKYYDTYQKVENEDGTVSYVPRDAKWESCEALLDVALLGRDLLLSDGTTKTIKTPIVIDNQQPKYLDTTGNLYKAMMIYRMLGAQKYTELKEGLQKTYVDVDGTVKEYINNFGLPTVALNGTTAWPSEGKIPVNEYFGITDSNIDTEEYFANPFRYPDRLADDYWIYNGDSVLIPVNISTTVRTGSGFEERVGSSPTAVNVLQYLLGAKDGQIVRFDYTMNVLEVQPSNSFDYDTFDKVKALGEKLLMSSVSTWTEENYRQYLNVDCVSTNALNGMTDDLLATYDMIIIGENTDLLTKDTNGNTIYNDRNLNGYIYLAYGDLSKLGTSYLGYLPSEYEKLTPAASGVVTLDESTKYMWTDNVYDALTAAGGTGKRFVLKNMHEYYKIGGVYKPYNSYNSSTGELYLNYELGNTRSSDNDITDITKEKLVQFAKSGKPIVLGESLYNVDGSKIYPTSDLFDLLKKYDQRDENGDRIYSIVRQSRIGGAVLYRNNGLPTIEMIDKPAEPAYANGVITSFGSRDLHYKFKITGQMGATYRVKLLVDKNSDGVFKDVEAGLPDDRNELYYAERVTLSGENYTEYIIDSKLAENFVGILSWKIEVIQLDEAGNETAYATSVKGFSAIKNEQAQVIRVLQVVPDAVTTQNGGTCTLNLATNTDFVNLLNAVEDEVGYDIIIESKTAEEFEALYEADAAGSNKYTRGVDIDTERDKLRSYDMVVLGFADIYGSNDISNANGALDNILDFIDIGKAVLFTHDTLSWIASPNYTTANVGGSAHVALWNTYKVKADGSTVGNNAGFFSASITNELRSIVGMDKYGITMSEDERDGKEKPYYDSQADAPKYTTQSADGKYYVSELQGFTAWNAYRGSYIKTFLSEYQLWGNNGLYSIIPYTNTEQYSHDLWTTTKVARLNEGAVTMYPYAIDENLTVATTHAQYYELDMEDDDIVVWYTLSDDGSGQAGYYECTEKDAGNNYYIYSKNNITYSGAGHSTMNSEMELKLFVNTIVKAIAGGNNAPVLTVTNGAKGDGGIYFVYTNSADFASTYEIDILATDLDLVSLEATNGNVDLVGNFKEAYVYWVKPDGTEKLIKTFDSTNPLKNGIVRKLTLEETSLNWDELEQIEDLVEETDGGYAQFRIVVSDWLGASDEVSVRMVERNLFELD